ncbi:MAG: zf-HC2 domain-containing protein [Actinomycetota bacterium]
MSDRNEMTCAELVELVTDYLEDAMSAHERARVDAHLTDCPGCSNYLSQMRTTIRVTGALTETAVPDGAVEHLMEAFRTLRST